MRIARVDDCPLAEAQQRRYDLSLFASGYERRCTHVSTRVPGDHLGHRLTLGFNEMRGDPDRTAHDAYFASAEMEPVVLSASDDSEVIRLLRDLRPQLPRRTSVLIDYSSMSRTWVNAIINFFKFDHDFESVQLTFAYTVGNHVDIGSFHEYPSSDFTVNQIETLPTLEGAAVRPRRTSALVGLGFEWVSPFAACELIEPDEVLAFCAEPGAYPNYGDIARRKNRHFLSEFCKTPPINLPLRSVEMSYRSLSEAAAARLETQNVVLIPLGPKPHVLASMLVSNLLPAVTCLYVRGSRPTVIQVEAAATDDIVCTRVALTP